MTESLPGSSVELAELGAGAGADQVAAVVAIVHAAFGARPVLDPPSTALEETPASVATALSRGGGLLARVEGRPVGTLLLEPSAGHDPGAVLLRRVSVLPEAQGHGVAHALAEAAERWAARHGATLVEVVARAELPGTVRFWERQGYAETHRDGTSLSLAKALPVAVEVPTAEVMQELGRRVGARLRAGDLLVLTGDLGAGKTTLTQGLGEGLGVRGGVTSPTFVISRVHPSLRGGPPLVHVDAYRLGGLAELDDLDLDVSVEDSVTVVEWGEGLAEALADDRVEVVVTRATGEDAGEGRRVRVTPAGAGWLPRWAALAGEVRAASGAASPVA